MSAAPTRSVSALFVSACEGEEEALNRLRMDGSAEVFDFACARLQSNVVTERQLAADVLGQLAGDDERKRQCADPLLKLLERETEASVLASALHGLGHLQTPRAPEAAHRFINHPEENVRFGVAFALLPHTSDLAINDLITLTSDEDADVRNWATFGLGAFQDTPIDTPAIRAALTARLHDTDDETRGEAISGLAVRKDLSVAPLIRAALEAPKPMAMLVDAARDLGDTSLLEPLRRLRATCTTEDYFTSRVDDAITTLEQAVAAEPQTR